MIIVVFLIGVPLDRLLELLKYTIKAEFRYSETFPEINLSFILHRLNIVPIIYAIEQKKRRSLALKYYNVVVVAVVLINRNILDFFLVELLRRVEN